MTEISPELQVNFRSLIERFLGERLDAKLEKLDTDDPKRKDLITQFSWTNWIDDAARRVGQIQSVTHSLKATHPDARGTNLYCHPNDLSPRTEMGSHALGDTFSNDVVGNAAALDVYKFLRLEVDGKMLLDWMLAGDANLKAALSDDPKQANAWIDAFTGLVRPRGAMSSHTRAKQLYWLAGDDPCEDSHYHILAPLYATSLAHEVFQTINGDRFSESAKTARQARRNKQDHDTGYAEYPDLAVQKLGGTKPQNISQLNSERGGNNYLLGSLPPSWKARNIRPLFFMDSIFPVFGGRKLVRELVQELRNFLKSQPPPTMETRNHRDLLMDTIIDELVNFARERQNNLDPGWTLDEKCILVEDEQLWLDPYRMQTDKDFRERWQRTNWPADIGKRFGNWLNAQLDDKLPIGEVEQRHWTRELLVNEDWIQMLEEQRRRLKELEPHLVGGAI